MTAITIVTSTLNALPALKATAASIHVQSFLDWQWVVIDGASSDGTAAWLDEQARICPKLEFLSEPDTGIYDAWNKALPRIRGEWVLFLGAGDRLHDAATLRGCLRDLASCPAGINVAYGRVELMEHFDDPHGAPLSIHWEGLEGTWAHGGPSMPPHAGIIQRASLLQDGRGFDTSFRIAADRAKLLPDLLRNGAYQLDRPVTLILLGGVSSRIDTRGKVVAEVVRINWMTGIGHRRIAYQLAALIHHNLRAFRFQLLRRLRG